ncbi:MAG: DUF4430 domain-containing protein [Lachnospiraceae bacterium]|nr:DUF4430 domain-containing protein [Lachnospiraceae bacterium]
MQMKSRKKHASFILCTMLIVAMAFAATGCNGSTKKETPAADTAAVSTAADSTVLGEGSTSFLFTATDTDGNETHFEIHTDRETVGEALTELDLISGDEGDYGLYVKTVNGITVDYDTDGKYWAFYVDGEYATAGVDATPVTPGASYSFKAE